MMNDKAQINQLLPSGQQPNMPSLPSGGMFGGGSGLPSPSGGSFGSSKFSLGKVMEFVDRMGGIQGIMSAIERIQNIVVTIQQFAPLIALLIPKKKSPQNELPAGAANRPRKRRKRRKTYGKRKRARK
ncbi:hypothetical protein [Ferviditalea candida]|uniref:Tyrosine protein kinase n=1 Tax=Ferviditalea candida TaxID=3108399 RepID=A0ABU5ZHH9_9BACL|nr:hypothetical protein [Paenibacillaceae bacterium T2]